jgi:hypothetical protein
LNARHRKPARSWRRLLGVVVLACALPALVLGLAGGGSATGSAQAAPGEGPEDSYQADAAVPAVEVTMLGASSSGETLGIGKVAQGTQNFAIVQYAPGQGWTRAPAILGSSEQPLIDFVPASSVLAGQVAANGAAVLAGFGGEKAEVLLVRAPGRAFQETTAPDSGGETLLQAGEELFNRHTPLVAALEEGSSAGALVVPQEVGEGVGEPGVLHWEGQTKQWTREAVELPSGHTAVEFRAVAIGASSATNAWLLAHVSTGSEAVSLFHRQPGAKGAPAVWKPVSPGGGQPAGAALSIPPKGGAEPESVDDEAETVGQALTVTERGLWVDGRRTGAKSLTLFFAPASEGEGGEVKASWCKVEGSEPNPCSSTLPEELPTGEYRSFAWAGSPEPGSSEYGQRVITGLPEGLIMRFQGSEYELHPTAGGPAAPEDIGASRGAAYASAYEGWLGNSELPVHATLKPEADELEYWPAPFAQPLLAIAPQPHVAVGALGSGALVVGEDGEVARYSEHEGWEAEGLREASGRVAHPQLHAVAWPKRSRAYAVGTRFEPSGSAIAEMWLWREETGLWEPDPAAPVNLRANLLGIAFAPSEEVPGEEAPREEITRGYVVGQGGTLLRYGKTWTQERVCEAAVPQPCIPPEAAGASFTSVAFAGSEAFIAFRVPHLAGGALSYTGGVLVNNGSGWRVDSEIAAALPSGFIPWGVAGLPDGGAAVSGSFPGDAREPLVLERNTATSNWEPTPIPYPGFSAPASMALFRENGALRVIGSGAIPNTLAIDEQTPPPAGFPAAQVPAYPLGLATGVLRQTATGWSDEEHERHVLHPPAGGFLHWDMPYEPDPTAAILVNESGTQGWAVGGLHDELNAKADTSDIARFPAEHPGKRAFTPGSGVSAVPLEPAEGGAHATFAFGSGAQCAAACADMVNAKIGPDRWLETAIERANRDSGLSAFLYAGPRVTLAQGNHGRLPVPYQREYANYAEVLQKGDAEAAEYLSQSGRAGSPVPIYLAASGTDREPNGSECTFTSALGEQLPEAPNKGQCASEEAAYYAFTSGSTPKVRVIVLDDATGVGGKQLEWLEQELKIAAGAKVPAIVVGSGDLAEQQTKPAPLGGEAASVVHALVAGGAAAYLFDAPEENVALSLESEGQAIPAYGSGTLGYVNAVNVQQSQFIGASGFLLVEVGEDDKATRVEPDKQVEPVTRVTPHLIPNIEELSLDAHKGTILHRSEAAVFSALARLPRAGGVAAGQSTENEAASFVPIPANCVGADCAQGIFPEYRFSSSEEEIGKFVKPNLQAEPNGEQPLLVNHETEVEKDAQSALFCALNPGETTVKIEAGGLSASLRVTVQAGSVRRPCGTVPFHKGPVKTHERGVNTPPPPASQPPTGSSPAPLVPVPPLPAAVVPAPPVPPAPRPLIVPPFLLPPAPVVPGAVIVPPPLPPVAEPTPPSGTSAVTSPVEAAQKEEEQEEATESVSAQASAYHAEEHEPAPEYLLGLMVLAALAGVGVRRRPRRGRRGVRVAPATVTADRSQRRMTGRRRRW